MAEANAGTAPYTLQGRELTHDWLVSRWTDGATQAKPSRDPILAVRGLRRKETRVKLAPTWAQRFPEAAGWVVKTLPQRRTLERDVMAMVMAVEPSFSRKATGFLDRDRDYAEELEGYMEEWRKRHVPTPWMARKGVEDGQYGFAIIPTDVDWSGCPQFYEYLDQAAYDALDDEERKQFAEHSRDPRRRYVKADEQGGRVARAEYDRDKNGKPRVKDTPFERDHDKSKEAHDQVVQRYLLQQEPGASVIKRIPALDCAPSFKRGRKRNSWELHHLVTREQFYPEELPADFGWRGMGDAALIPQGYSDSSTVGQNGQFYLYTLYFVWVDPKTKIEHPLICHSVGGFPTWRWSTEQRSETPITDTVAVLDLYESHGLEGAFWGYAGGMQTGDDDPAHSWEPYLWPLYETILGIEGEETHIAASTAVQSTLGYYSKPDAKLIELDGESLMDAATGKLITVELPLPGQVVQTHSDIFPATPAPVGLDAWRKLETSKNDLREATAQDQPTGQAASGNAQLVKNTLSQVAKLDIREGILDATTQMGECHLKILYALANPKGKFGVCWPIQTTEERPVGSEMREGDAILTFKPEWVEGRAGKQFRLICEYPEEANPIKVDMAEKSYAAGTGTLRELCEAKGIKDTDSYRAELMEDQMFKDPSVLMVMQTRVAKRTGNAMLLEVKKLQAAKEMTEQGAPGGFEAGLPTAALRRPGEGSGQTTASRMRAGAKGGVMAAQQQGAEQQLMASQPMMGAA